MMQNKIFDVIKTMDLEEIDAFIDKDKIHTMRFSQKRDHSEIFLQLAFDGDISFDEYYRAENGILCMCNFFYQDNIGDDIYSYIIAEEDSLKDGFYSKETLSEEERNFAQLLLDKIHFCPEIKVLELIVKLACREIAVAVVYFKKKNLLLVVDALGGAIWSHNMEYAIEALFKMESDFTINYFNRT